MKITLPFPPSSNRYWRHFRGRMVVSAEARAYRLLVASLCVAEGVQPIDGDISITAAVYRPQKRGDLDNRLKIVLDALQGCAFDDDKQIVEIRLSRFDDKANPRVEVSIQAGRSS